MSNKYFSWNYKRTKEYRIKSYQKKASWLAIFFLFFQFVMPPIVAAGDISGLGPSPALKRVYAPGDSALNTFTITFDGLSMLDYSTVNHTNMNIRNYFTDAIVSTGVTGELGLVTFTVPGGVLPTGTYYYYISDAVRFADNTAFPSDWGTDTVHKKEHYFSISDQNTSHLSFSPELGSYETRTGSFTILIIMSNQSTTLDPLTISNNIEIRDYDTNVPVSGSVVYDEIGISVQISIPSGAMVLGKQYYYYLGSALAYPTTGLKYDDGSAFPMGFGGAPAEKSLHAFTYSSSHNLVVSKTGTGAGTVTSNPSGVINCGTTCSSEVMYGDSLTLTATPSAGSLFTGWSGGCTGTGTCSLAVTGDINVSANFTAELYSLTTSVGPAGSGIITKSPNQASYLYGDSVTLTASATSGYEFSSWSGDCTGTSNPITLVMNSNKTCDANFTAVPYYFSSTVNPAGSGIITWSPNQDSYVIGDSVTLTATATPGYEFSSWGGDCTGTTNTCTLTVSSSDINVSANFTAVPYSLSASVSPAGSGTVTQSPNQTSYVIGDSVTLTATPASGYEFSSWSGDCTGTTNTCTLTVSSSDINVSANFTAVDSGGTPLPGGESGTLSGDIVKSGIDIWRVVMVNLILAILCTLIFSLGIKRTRYAFLVT